jgi:hypothetical protein
MAYFILHWWCTKSALMSDLLTFKVLCKMYVIEKYQGHVYINWKWLELWVKTDCLLEKYKDVFWHCHKYCYMSNKIKTQGENAFIFPIMSTYTFFFFFLEILGFELGSCSTTSHAPSPQHPLFKRAHHQFFLSHNEASQSFFFCMKKNSVCWHTDLGISGCQEKCDYYLLGLNHCLQRS